MNGRIVFFILILTFLLLGLVVRARAAPLPPCVFYGYVYVNGIPAQDGLTITATINGTSLSYTTQTKAGTYGWGAMGSSMLGVPSDDPGTPEKDGGVNGDMVDFYVSGVLTNGTATFESGGTLRIDLAAEVYPSARVVGVSVGDKFRYSTTVSWSSNDPSATPTSDLVDANNTEWAEFTVTAISSTNITVQGTTHYKNGTETTMGGWIDVNTGFPLNGNLTAVFISANLSQGDSLYTSSQYNTWFINETVLIPYLSGVVRDTNHFNMTYSGMQGGVQTGLMDFYWDRSTGVLVKMLKETTTHTGAYTTTSSLDVQIISSNVWIVPEFPTWTPALLILIAFTSATMVIARQRQPRRARATTC